MACERDRSAALEDVFDGIAEPCRRCACIVRLAMVIDDGLVLHWPDGRTDQQGACTEGAGAAIWIRSAATCSWISSSCVLSNPLFRQSRAGGVMSPPTAI